MRNFNTRTFVSSLLATAVILIGMSATAAGGGTWLDVEFVLNSSYTGTLTNPTVVLNDHTGKMIGFCTANNSVTVGASHQVNFTCPLTGQGADAKTVKFVSNQVSETWNANLLTPTKMGLYDLGTSVLKGVLVAFDMDDQPTW